MNHASPPATTTPAAPPLLAVVVPYFQRSAGLLTRSVSSVLGQACGWRVQVVVADDSSPLPARQELPPALLQDPRVRVLTQPNAGPSAARNLALDNLHPDTQFVALLDADDWWEPGFAAAAQAAFQADEVDIFFSDSRRYSEAQTRMQWAADAQLNLDPAAHPLLAADSPVRELRMDFFDLMVRRSSIVGTSSMVFRRERAPDLRFDPRLRGGEDRLFKLQLAQRVRRARFSALPLTAEGEGINVFDSVSWGTPQGLRLAADYLLMGKRILAELELTPAQRRQVLQQLHNSRREVLGNTLGMLRQRRPPDWRLLARTWAADPALPAWLPAVLARSALPARRAAPKHP